LDVLRIVEALRIEQHGHHPLGLRGEAGVRP
jgi:hypothetical protein